MTVTVVRTGVANLASVIAALRRAGCTPVASDDADAIVRAEHAVLPGVGSFAAGMERLSRSGLGEAIRERVRSGKPLLAICLGLQLLCEESEESPGVRGLSLVPGTIRRFSPHEGLSIPQLGWNRVTPRDGARLLAEGYAYFANSYRLEQLPAGFAGAMADHGGPFVAAFEREALLACQFHPELSGAWGQALIERWHRGGAAC